jgi:hypothetical protein
MNNSVTLRYRGGCSLLVLNRSKEEQEEKCLSRTGRREYEPIGSSRKQRKGGKKKKEKKLVNNKGKGRGEK